MHIMYSTLALCFISSSYAMHNYQNREQEKFIEGADKGDINYVLDALDRDTKLLCAIDCTKHTALHRALLRGNKHIALILIQEAYAQYQELGQQLSAEYPLNIQDFEGNTPLHIAFEKQYTDIVLELCKAYADITLANNKHITPAELLVEYYTQEINKNYADNCPTLHQTTTSTLQDTLNFDPKIAPHTTFVDYAKDDKAKRLLLESLLQTTTDQNKTA